MRAFLSLVAIAIFFLLISCSPSETSPTAASSGKQDGTIQSTDVTHRTFDTRGVVTNACIPERVTYDGVLKLTIKVKEQGNGSTSRLIESDIKAKGVGSVSGDAYEIMSSSGSVNAYEVGPPFPREFTSFTERKLVSKGSSANAWVTFKTVTTWDENGVLIGQETTSTTDCK